MTFQFFGQFMFIRSIIIKLSGLFLLATTLSACTQPPYHNLNNEQLKVMVKQGTPIYDIRRAEEWRETEIGRAHV